MKEFVTDDSQKKTLDEFKESMIDGSMDSFLLLASIQMRASLMIMENTVINGQRIVDTEIYNTHTPLFREISEKSINKYDSMKVFGFSELEIEQMKSDKPDKKEIANKFASMFNIDLNDQEHIKENVINGIIGKMSPDIMKQNNEFLSFSSQEMNKILNGIEVYSKIDEKNKSKKDLEDKEYTSLNLYRDAVEIYLKVLKEAYRKIHKTTKDVRNDKMYDYFQEHYPLLWDSQYNLLRNDISHLNFDVRGNYTIDKIDSERNTILLKAMTGIMARNMFLIEYFETSLEAIFDPESEEPLGDEIPNDDNNNTNNNI